MRVDGVDKPSINKSINKSFPCVSDVRDDTIISQRGASLLRTDKLSRRTAQKN